MAAFLVGVTGGVASGKSSVTAMFKSLGVAVIDADVVARHVVAPGQPALFEVVERFGPDILLNDGSLDRVRLRSVVFADPHAKEDLETITHPRIRELLHAECVQASGPYVLAAIPLLAETGAVGAYGWLSRVLVVDAPPTLQRARVVARDHISQDLANRMIEAQASREHRLIIATDVVINDGAVSELLLPVARLDRMYREIAAGTALCNS